MSDQPSLPLNGFACSGLALACVLSASIGYNTYMCGGLFEGSSWTAYQAVVTLFFFWGRLVLIIALLAAMTQPLRLLSKRPRMRKRFGLIALLMVLGCGIAGNVAGYTDGPEHSCGKSGYQ